MDHGCSLNRHNQSAHRLCCALYPFRNQTPDSCFANHPECSTNRNVLLQGIVQNVNCGNINGENGDDDDSVYDDDASRMRFQYRRIYSFFFISLLKTDYLLNKFKKRRTRACALAQATFSNIIFHKMLPTRRDGRIK